MKYYNGQKIKGRARGLDLDCVFRAMANASRPGFNNKFINPRHKRKAINGRQLTQS